MCLHSSRAPGPRVSRGSAMASVRATQLVPSPFPEVLSKGGTVIPAEDNDSAANAVVRHGGTEASVGLRCCRWNYSLHPERGACRLYGSRIGSFCSRRRGEGQRDGCEARGERGRGAGASDCGERLVGDGGHANGGAGLGRQDAAELVGGARHVSHRRVSGFHCWRCRRGEYRSRSGLPAHRSLAPSRRSRIGI